MQNGSARQLHLPTHSCMYADAYVYKIYINNTLIQCNAMMKRDRSQCGVSAKEKSLWLCYTKKENGE